MPKIAKPLLFGFIVIGITTFNAPVASQEPQERTKLLQPELFPRPEIKPVYVAPSDTEIMQQSLSAGLRLVKRCQPSLPDATICEMVGNYWLGAKRIYEDEGIQEAGLFLGIDEIFFLLLSRDKLESGFNPKARRANQDFGLSQINRCNWQRLGITWDNWYLPEVAIRAGVEHLLHNLKGTGRTWAARSGRERGITLALAEYNAGPRLTSRGYIPDNGITPAYCARIMRDWREMTATRPQPPKPARTYTVQPGDTLWKIAQRFGATVQELARRNGIKDANLIRVGQVLEVE